MILDDVFENEIRLITKMSTVRITCAQDPLYNREGIACEDGDLFGWCCVEIDSNRYKLPSIYLEPIHTKPPEHFKWKKKTCVPIHVEIMVPVNPAGVDIPFKGDNSAGNIDRIQNLINTFDPMDEITPQKFKTFNLSMRAWNDNEQKDAVVESLI